MRPAEGERPRQCVRTRLSVHGVTSRSGWEGAAIWMASSRRSDDCRADYRARVLLKSDSREASISGGFGCRVRGRPSRTAFSFERSAPAIALDVHLNDGDVVNETIDGGEPHGGVAEHVRVPLFLSGSCLTSRSRTRINFFFGHRLEVLKERSGAAPPTSLSRSRTAGRGRFGSRRRILPSRRSLPARTPPICRASVHVR